jgi:O-antigen biosynthesis protein
MQKTISIEQTQTADTEVGPRPEPAPAPTSAPTSEPAPTPTSEPATRPATRALARPCVRGKFLFQGEQKLYVRGVTYGPFAPTEDGERYRREQAARDFAAMCAHGINSIRTYDVPPRWLLDLAAEQGLLVMVGIPWEQHVAFLKGRRTRRSIAERVREGVRACAGHPAVLCYAIGNEIPGPIVRWHGRRAIERFLRRLYHIAKLQDPEGLVTYVNYPTTEYLQLNDFVDFLCFNVYLERRERLEAYLARLQNLAGERPLVMGEIGLDSARHGAQRQAEVLEWQIETAFQSGCGGAFVFAWTDEWHRGGHEIEGWDFGLTTRARTPKPALGAVSRAFADAPLRPPSDAPLFSVIVCTYNGARTLDQCLAGLGALDYPNYEVIVVSDGSTDETEQIARRHAEQTARRHEEQTAWGHEERVGQRHAERIGRRHEVRFVQTENRGLSSARNLGLSLARGELVAYLDDDASPDPHWLTYLAHHFQQGEDVGVGGPNLPFPEDGPVAQGVANAPGGPTHVLLDDRHAEHIPGCNMAFRRRELLELEGFDERFRIAGDDVDLCWRVLERGWTLGFNPGAVVWHHRRDSVRGYLSQQRGYGRAEALLERKWPEKYGPAGHVAWSGRMYGNGSAQHHGGGRWRVYYGAWGSGFFQSIYQPAAGGLLRVLPLMPEWYLVIAGLGLLALVGAVWTPLLLTIPLLVVAAGILVFDAALGAVRASFEPQERSRARLAQLRALTAALYLSQPLARLWGRVKGGLTPWRRRGRVRLAAPWGGETSAWSERWASSEERVRVLQRSLRNEGTVVLSGGDWDRWDLEVRGGAIGSMRLRMAVEEHGAGRQLVRLRWWLRLSLVGAALLVCMGVIAVAAGLRAQPTVAVLASLAEALLIGRLVYEWASASGAVDAAAGEQASASRAVVLAAREQGRLDAGEQVP